MMHCSASKMSSTAVRTQRLCLIKELKGEKNSSLKNIAAIAEALGVTLPELYKLKNEK